MSERAPGNQRTFAGMIGAMLVTVAVGGGWYLLGRPSEDQQPITSQPWAHWVKSGRSDGKLAVLAPESMPKGWVVRAAGYDSGTDPRWRLALLDENGRFVGVEESPRSTEDLVEEYVDENATRGKDVQVGGITWQSYTDAGGDYAIVRTLQAPGGGQERVLVYGSAADAEIRTFAGTLSATSTPTDTAPSPAAS